MVNTMQKVECMEIDKSGPSSSYSSPSNYTSFSAFFHEKQEHKLQDIWPMVESSLEEYGIACALNLAERSVTVSKTRTTKGRNYFEKAKRLVELLTTTHVPPHMVIEILHGDRRHILIKIGNQEGGLCSKYGIQKEKFVKQRECLACSLEALAALTCCNLFLNENTLTAVGVAQSFLAVRNIVIDCIVNNMYPETCISELKKIILERRAKNLHLQHPNVDYSGMEKCGPCLDSYGMLEVSSYCSPVLLGREKEVHEAWPFVQRFLGGYGISCTVNTAERCLTFSTTRRTMDLDIIHKTGDFLELLARTGTPATKAVEILNGHLQHEVIKTGFQDGGLRTKFEIEKEYDKNRDRLKRNSQALARLLKCDIYINGCSAVAVGTSAEGLRLFRSVVESCFVKNEDPVTVARRLKLDRKTYGLTNKLEDLCL